MNIIHITKMLFWIWVSFLIFPTIYIVWVYRDMFSALLIEAKNQIYWDYIRHPLERLIIVNRLQKRIQIHRKVCFDLLCKIEQEIKSCQSVNRLSILFQTQRTIEDAIFIIERFRNAKTQWELKEAEIHIAKLESNSHTLLNSIN